MEDEREWAHWRPRVTVSLLERIGCQQTIAIQPQFAWGRSCSRREHQGVGATIEAIGIEPRVGAMLPCNVILREVTGGVEVSAIDPVALMQAIDNAELTAVAGQVRDLLAKAVAAN
jgi:hypothetical protein